MKKFIAASCIFVMLFCMLSVNVFANQTDEPNPKTIDTDNTETESTDIEKVETQEPEENTEQTPENEDDKEPSEPEIKDVFFDDVAADSWYRTYVDYAVENKIFEGTSEKEFSPDMTMTRAQIVQVFANIAGVDTSDNSKESKFTDVEKDKWYTAAVIWAAENKIAEGTSDNTFAPEEPVTREQMCVMLVNYVENYLKESFQGTAAIIPFSDDKQISDWARYSVYICRRAELIDGTGNGNFKPQEIATRAVAATIFTDFHQNYVE